MSRNGLESEPRDRFAVRIAGDVLVCVPRNIRLMTPYVLLEQEDWFEDDIRFVRAMLQPGESVIDIGASYGVYTLSMARAVGATGKVWAIEPSPATMAHLECSIARNRFGNVTPIRAGLSDRPGRAYLPREANTELGAVVAEATAGKDCDEVELLSLDECAPRYPWRDICFVKMDAEGHEERIIAGGGRFLDSNSPLILYEIKASNRLNLGILDAFAAMGYRSYRLVPGLNALAPFHPGDPLDPDQLNLFCCKPDRAEILSRRGMLIEDYVRRGPDDSSAAVWLDYLRGFPYARGLIAAWRQYSRTQGARTDWQQHEAALNDYAQAHNPALSISDRYSALQRAHARLAELLRTHATFERLLSFARIAVELGKRAEAVRALRHLIGNPPPPLSSYLCEPFLAPADVFESLDPGSNLSEWLRDAVLARYEKLWTFSSFFRGQDRGLLESSLERLDAIVGSPFCSPEMERRRQLIRLRTGLQRFPELAPILSRRTAENLNPDFWTGASHG